MTLLAAITHLADITYPSPVSLSYDLDTLPQSLERADMPSLIPRLLDQRRGQDTQASSQLTLDGSRYVFNAYVEHIAYWRPLTDGLYKELLPQMVTFIDDYIGLMPGNRLMGGNLAEPLVITTIEIADFGYPNPITDPSRFWAVRFLHHWKFVVEAA
jgi:hypothetical protein